MYPYSTTPSFSFSFLIVPGLIGLVVFLVIFLIFRFFNLWYWRINEITDLLKEIRNNTKNEIVGWYKKAGDNFLCKDCFHKRKDLNKEDYRSVKGEDLNKNVYICDDCKKEI